MAHDVIIPEGPDQLTDEWLTEVLHQHGALPPSAIVAGSDIERIGEGVGFIGVIARVRLNYRGDATGAPATLIAKFPSPDPGARQIGQMYGLYEREVRFYRDLAPTVGVRAPTCYHSAMDTEAGRYLLLLEDLAPHGVLGDQVQGCSPAEALVAIDELATLHAGWWASPRLDEVPWLQRGTDLVRAPMQFVYGSVVDRFLELFGDRLPAAVRAAVPALGQSMLQVLDDIDASTVMTLVHGDYRLDNIFYGRDGAPYRMAVVDWQSLNIGWGAYDLAYFMAGSMPAEQRRACEGDVLARYHDILMRQGVKDYAPDQLFLDYRRSLMAYLAIFVINGATLEMSNQRAVDLFELIFDRLVAAITDLDALATLPA